MFLKTMEHHLQQKLKHNVKISSYNTGEECLKHIDEKPGIVVLDYILNGNYPYAMNGISVLQKIKEHSPDTEVIMLSAQDKMEVAVDTMKNGAYDYVVKNHNTLFKTQHVIRNAISNMALKKENRIYKFLVKTIFVLIAAVVIGAMIVQLTRPSIMR
jgi:DNA-binding NtrC family response regulator